MKESSLPYNLHIPERKIIDWVSVIECQNLEEQSRYYLTHSWEEKEVHIFPKVICPKVNEIEQVEFELAYHDSTLPCLNHYTTRTSTKIMGFTTFLMELAFLRMLTDSFKI